MHDGDRPIGVPFRYTPLLNSEHPYLFIAFGTPCAGVRTMQQWDLDE